MISDYMWTESTSSEMVQTDFGGVVRSPLTENVVTMEEYKQNKKELREQR